MIRVHLQRLEEELGRAAEERVHALHERRVRRVKSEGSTVSGSFSPAEIVSGK